MPAALLKLDENVPDLVAEILGAAGHDAALARDEKLAGVEDEALLGAAITEARALVTFDFHFSDIRLHDPSGTPGIVVLRLRARRSGEKPRDGHDMNNKRSAVPRHTEISNDLARKIWRDLGIPPVK